MRHARWTSGHMMSLAALSVAGCGTPRKSALLLERQARGVLMEEGEIATQVGWQLQPSRITKIDHDIEIFVAYASPAYLQEFFKNKRIFAEFAGLNPYFNEQMVFYVKIANTSQKKIHIDPTQFVLLDDKGDQYSLLQPDYIIAMADAKAPMATVTRGMMDEARPGYFGFGVPVGKIFPKSQQRYALLQLSQLKEGELYPGVVYDGLVSFWNPHEAATKLQLVMANITSDFDANGEAKATMDVVFEMAASHVLVPPASPSQQSEASHANVSP